jgi:hypothetical protein
LIISKKSSIIRLQTTNGELHFLFKESPSPTENVEETVYDEIQARKVSKIEAYKPLLLIRE